MRVGIGYDSHRFDDGRPLVLGGVEIPGHAGLAGHSDGDAVAHAVADALLGAAALGDIGSHFPPSEERWCGADSIDLLAASRTLVEHAGFRVANVDVTVVCESPRIGPHAERMRQRLAGALKVPGECVSVKGKSNEGLGWIGAGEGLAALAVAAIERTR